VELSDRKKNILRAVIDNYIETAEPVGSKAIASGLGLSSATIRNEMAELKSMGYLERLTPPPGVSPPPWATGSTSTS
jgi:heat-inducible transcriptional repressor